MIFFKQSKKERKKERRKNKNVRFCVWEHLKSYTMYMGKKKKKIK